MVLHIPHHFQLKRYTCGPACVRAVGQFFGKRVHESTLERRVLVTKTWGTSRKNMLRLIRSIGLTPIVYPVGSLQTITSCIADSQPVIVNYQVPKYEEDHYAVVKDITKQKVLLSDPSRGKHFSISKKEFLRRWKNPRLRRKYTGWMVAVTK